MQEFVRSFAESAKVRIFPKRTRCQRCGRQLFRLLKTRERNSRTSKVSGFGNRFNRGYPRLRRSVSFESGGILIEIFTRLAQRNGARQIGIFIPRERYDAAGSFVTLLLSFIDSSD